MQAMNALRGEAWLGKLHCVYRIAFHNQMRDHQLCSGVHCEPNVGVSPLYRIVVVQMSLFRIVPPENVQW
jgi:hypothetical protein